MVLLHSALRASSYRPSPDHDHRARFPPGVVNTVPSLGSVGGAALSAHNDVDKVAFTGSTVTGRKIMEAAAKSNLKKVCIPLTGRGSNLLYELNVACPCDRSAWSWAESRRRLSSSPRTWIKVRDIPLAYHTSVADSFVWFGDGEAMMRLIYWGHLAANHVALGILFNTGQDCTAGSRLFVQDTIYDKFIQVCTYVWLGPPRSTI